jgi:hypothetical protein
MQFSALKMPVGPKEVQEHLRSGKKLGQPRIAKVIPIADATEGRCAHCGLVLHDKSNADTTRTDSKYCDSACKVAAYRARRVRKAA